MIVIVVLLVSTSTSGSLGYGSRSSSSSSGRMKGWLVATYVHVLFNSDWNYYTVYMYVGLEENLLHISL